MSIRTLNVAADYTAGGGMSSLYHGRVDFCMNAGRHESDGEIQERAKERAREKAAQSGCWALSEVVITSLIVGD
jgi:hypothetical protein